MRSRSASKTVPGLLLLFAALGLAPPSAALDADYWRGGWRTPLGEGTGPAIQPPPGRTPIGTTSPGR
jgi:hypothetical protein